MMPYLVTVKVSYYTHADSKAEAIEDALGSLEADGYEVLDEDDATAEETTYED
jgi:hypothetical protein